jgi:hypothetical protein
MDDVSPGCPAAASGATSPRLGQAQPAPQPPPPGVSITNTSPGAISTLAM